ncbi:hypothetical protein IH992_06110 [Candidatus Poribacteria bacterium]|nr:hypothetical protein [Candidatus Poribacteria bacterium]
MRASRNSRWLLTLLIQGVVGLLNLGDDFAWQVRLFKQRLNGGCCGFERHAAFDQRRFGQIQNGLLQVVGTLQVRIGCRIARILGATKVVERVYELAAPIQPGQVEPLVEVEVADLEVRLAGIAPEGKWAGGPRQVSAAQGCAIP